MGESETYIEVNVNVKIFSANTVVFVENSRRDKKNKRGRKVNLMLRYLLHNLAVPTAAIDLCSVVL